MPKKGVKMIMLKKNPLLGKKGPALALSPGLTSGGVEKKAAAPSKWSPSLLTQANVRRGRSLAYQVRDAAAVAGGSRGSLPSPTLTPHVNDVGLATSEIGVACTRSRGARVACVCVSPPVRSCAAPAGEHC